MLRPSPNHETLWLHNDDDDDEIIKMYSTRTEDLSLDNPEMLMRSK